MTTHRDSLIAAMVIFLLVDTVVLGARVFVRTRLLRGSFGRDDFVLCLTYIGYILHCGLESQSMYYGYSAPPDEKLPRFDSGKATKLLFANQLVIYICAGLVKLGVAFVLLRLVATRGLRWALYLSMVVVVAWTIVMTLYASYFCASSGSSNYTGSQTCTAIGYFRTSSNIVIDYFYALLPIYILWNVQMSLKLKLSVIILLGLGAFASAATIVKLVIIIELQTASGAEAKALHYDLLLWADIELGMALFAASAAALRPILGRLPSMWGSYFSKGSGYLSKGVKGTRHTSTNGSHGLDGVVGPYREVVGQSSREDIELGHVVGQRHHAGDGEIVKTTTVTVETGRDGGSGRAVSPSLAYIPSRDTFI